MSFSFQAFTEAELLATGLGNGGSLSTGDTFTIPAAASITFAGNDDDAFLSGDVSGDVARDTSGQEASIDDGSGDTGNGGRIFAELVRTAEDEDGNVYLLVQVEQDGTDDEFFTFYEGDYRGVTYSLPPAGTELTVTGSIGVGKNDEIGFDALAGVETPAQDPAPTSDPTQLSAHENDATFTADFHTTTCDVEETKIYTEDVWFAAAHDKIDSHIMIGGFGGWMDTTVDFTTNAAKYADLLDIERIVNVDFGNLQTAFGGAQTPDLIMGQPTNDGTVFEASFKTGSYSKVGWTSTSWQIDGINVAYSWKQLREEYEDRVDAQDYTLFYEDSHGVLSSLDLKTEATSRGQQVSPIAFDLTGDGKIGTTGDGTVKGHDWNEGAVENIDVDADGVAETIEWMDGQGDGLLIDLSKVAGFTGDYRPENIDELTSQNVTKVIEGVDSVYQAPAGFTNDPWPNGQLLPNGVLFDNAASRADRSSNDGVSTPTGTSTYWIDITAPGVESINLEVTMNSVVKFYASDPNSTHTVDNISVGTQYFNYYGYGSTVTSDLSVSGPFWNGFASEYTVTSPTGVTSTVTLSRDSNANAMQTSNDEPPHVFAPGTPDETVTETVFSNANGDELTSLTVDGTALFGDQGGAFANGYDKLSVLEDDNNDGVISGAELDNLAVWVDDGDARLEAGEIVSLADAGINFISTSMTLEADGRMTGHAGTSEEVEVDAEAEGLVTYSIEGADAGFFQIDAATGELTYADGFVPDFENPQDHGGDNIYDVTVVRTVADSVGCVKEALREDVQIKVEDKPENGSISGRYWCDVDGDGQDDGDFPAGEFGVGSALVELIDTNGDVVKTTTTNSETGTYSFSDVVEGDYTVRFEAPAGDKVFTDANIGDDATDSDVEVTNGDGTGTTGTVSVVAGQDTGGVNAGITAPPAEFGSVTGRVFRDFGGNPSLAGDGQDAGDFPGFEFGEANIIVELINGNGDVIGTKDTDEAGNYEFLNVPVGDYTVRFSDLPEDRGFTVANIGDDATDSDVIGLDPAAADFGQTDVFEILTNQTTEDIDAGLIKGDCGCTDPDID